MKITVFGTSIHKCPAKQNNAISILENPIEHMFHKNGLKNAKTFFLWSPSRAPVGGRGGKQAMRNQPRGAEARCGKPRGAEARCGKPRGAETQECRSKVRKHKASNYFFGFPTFPRFHHLWKSRYVKIIFFKRCSHIFSKMF